MYSLRPRPRNSRQRSQCARAMPWASRVSLRCRLSSVSGPKVSARSSERGAVPMPGTVMVAADHRQDGAVGRCPAGAPSKVPSMCRRCCSYAPMHASPPKRRHAGTRTALPRCHRGILSLHGALPAGQRSAFRVELAHRGRREGRVDEALSRGTLGAALRLTPARIEHDGVLGTVALHRC